MLVGNVSPRLCDIELPIRVGDAADATKGGRCLGAAGNRMHPGIVASWGENRYLRLVYFGGCCTDNRFGGVMSTVT